MLYTQDIFIIFKTSLPVDEADRLWKKYKESSHIYIGRPFQEIARKTCVEASSGSAHLARKHRKTVEVTYSGNYEDDSGAKKYEALGKCTIIVSKHSLLKDWTIKLA